MDCINPHLGYSFSSMLSQRAQRATGIVHQLLRQFPSSSIGCHLIEPSSESVSPFCHAYSAEAKPAESIGNEKVQRLASDIMNLTVLESSWLSEILRTKLNIQKPSFSGMPMMAASVAPAQAAPAQAPPPPEKKEKTEFEVKLESFSAEGKIKVIKEIRAITSLGLKEAKELVRRLVS